MGPLVPAPEEEPFEASLELEWPIAELEPLSFVLTRLLDPLCQRLERRDRGAAVLHLRLRLVTRDLHAAQPATAGADARSKVLRTLLLLDLESHPAPAGIDAVTLSITPTPGRIVAGVAADARAAVAGTRLDACRAPPGAHGGRPARFTGDGGFLSARGAFAMAPFVVEQKPGARLAPSAQPQPLAFAASAFPSPRGCCWTASARSACDRLAGPRGRARTCGSGPLADIGRVVEDAGRTGRCAAVDCRRGARAGTATNGTWPSATGA